MHLTTRIRAALGILAALTLLGACRDAAAPVAGLAVDPTTDPATHITITPTAIPDVLVNPGKGWVLYGSVADQTPASLALGSIGYHRFAWADFEPREGEFDWSKLDAQLAAWGALGKQFAFGVMGASSHSKTPYVTPKWVFDAGAKVRLIDMQTLANPYAGVPGVKAVPEFNDPIYLAKLEAFLTALAKHCDGDPRIAFIDVRSYGNWGEGHMYPFGGHELTAAEFHRHLALHRAAFQHTPLCVSAASKAHNEEYDWAAGHGMAIRCDGICGNGDGSSVQRPGSGVWSTAGTPESFGVFEFYGSYTWMKSQGWWEGKSDKKGYGHTLVDCVERGKPSYIGLSQGGAEAQQFLTAEKTVIEHLANRMGYHFILREAIVPTTWRAGEPQTLTCTWDNDGVARIHVPAALAVVLLDATGHVIAADWPEHADPRNWIANPVPQYHQIQVTNRDTPTVTFSHAPPGTYRLAVGLVAKSGDTTPTIALGIAGRTTDGWYPLTTVTVLP
jgi:hypothetical protein